MKAACPDCGRVVQVRPCPGGDGSAVRVSRHKAEPEHAVSCSGAYSQLDMSELVEEPVTSPAGSEVRDA